MRALSAIICLHNCYSAALAAEDLQLRSGIAFNRDVDDGFPIKAKHLDDITIEKGMPSFLFFGASGDLNTNRQAKRIVEIYKKLPGKSIKFILIDVDHPFNDAGKELIKSFYKGYIPYEIILDKDGKIIWSQIGEVHTNQLRQKLDEISPRSDK